MKDADTPQALEADAFEAEATVLREALLDAQFDFAERKRRALLILLNGADGSGKGEVLNRLHGWLDPRTLATLAFNINDGHGRRHPLAWRYWRDLPARGRIGIVLGSWYHVVLHHRATRESNRKDFLAEIAAINRIEDMLEAEGVMLVKIWLQRTDGKTARRSPNHTPGGPRNPLVREWGAIDTKKERRHLLEAAQELIAFTSDLRSPWHMIASDDDKARDLAVGRLVLAAIEAGNQAPRPAKGKPQSRPRRVSESPSALAALDLGRSIDKESYERDLSDAQTELFALTQSKAFQNRALICAFEGNDAAGKGGAIKRLRSALNPMTSRVIPIAAPTEEELAHPHLWRFWLQIPPRGRVTIFDRTWYGRVLVERVEGFAAPADWRRAYDEINDFERQLVRSGYILGKFWLSIDQDEQLRRFEARKETPHKRFKITDEDWRNREKWPLYAAAVEDMVALTSTEMAPWTLVEANDKRFARLKVVDTLVERLRTAL